MANPEMSSAQEQALGAVPPQGSRVEVGQVGQVAQVAGASDDGAGAASAGEASASRGGASNGDPESSSGAAGHDGWSEFDSASAAHASAGDPAGSSGAAGSDGWPELDSASAAVNPAGDSAGSSGAAASDGWSELDSASAARASAGSSGAAGFDARSDLSDPTDTAAASEPSELSAAPTNPPTTDQTGRSLPLLARVLFADIGVAIVALIALTVIEVQRMGEPTMSLRRQAYAEDLVVLFGVAVIFGIVALVLLRTQHTRVGLVQAVVTALVLGVAITSAATGVPKPITVEDVDH
ncbi:MAG: hypothetical protein HOW97_35300 [Catenulispora sp.]|nr:hypothetical protein [Catenulispora sp.]